MKKLRMVNFAAASLACLGMLVPCTPATAATPDQETPIAQAKPVTDVALGAGGTLTGQVLDEQGVVLDGAVVSVAQGKADVATAVTDQQGQFVAAGLRGGVYRIVAGQGEGTFRLWAPGTAPPSAKETATVVSGNEVARGQLGGLDIITLTTVTASVTAAILSAVALSEINDLEDQIEELTPSSP